MPSGPGNQRRMGEARGGMPGPPTCTLLFLNPTLIAVNSCRCWINDSVSSGLHEPPYTEPYVRWCGRTAEVTPPPTRFYESDQRAAYNRRSVRFVFAFCDADAGFAAVLAGAFACEF